MLLMGKRPQMEENKEKDFAAKADTNDFVERLWKLTFNDFVRKNDKLNSYAYNKASIVYPKTSYIENCAKDF